MKPQRHCPLLHRWLPTLAGMLRNARRLRLPGRLVLSALVASLAVSCAAPQPAAPRAAATNATALKPTDAVKHATISRWQPIFRGVEMCDGWTTTPRPIQVRAVRVNLREPTIDFLVTPSNGDEPKDVGARTASEFLTEFKCQVALNGSVFDVFAKQRGDPMDVQGLSLSRGDLYSPPNHWDALLISTNRRAWVARSPVDPRGAFNGLSGFYALLINGTNNGTMKDRHPRSAVGVSRNGRYLILTTVDGRQPGYSEGASTAETAEWMRKLGAYNALNLDGGGSTALVMEGADGSPVMLNRQPGGTQRRVANHLGVFAEKLPRKR
jgi:hypothetical protein